MFFSLTHALCSLLYQRYSPCGVDANCNLKKFVSLASLTCHPDFYKTWQLFLYDLCAIAESLVVISVRQASNHTASRQGCMCTHRWLLTQRLLMQKTWQIHGWEPEVENRVHSGCTWWNCKPDRAYRVYWNSIAPERAGITRRVGKTKSPYRNECTHAQLGPSTHNMLWTEPCQLKKEMRFSEPGLFLSNIQ